MGRGRGGERWSGDGPARTTSKQVSLVTRHSRGAAACNAQPSAPAPQLTRKRVGHIDLPLAYLPQQHTDDALARVLGDTVVVVDDAQKHERMHAHGIEHGAGTRRGDLRGPHDLGPQDPSRSSLLAPPRPRPPLRALRRPLAPSGRGVRRHTRPLRALAPRRRGALPRPARSKTAACQKFAPAKRPERLGPRFFRESVPRDLHVPARAH